MAYKYVFQMGTDQGIRKDFNAAYKDEAVMLAECRKAITDANGSTSMQTRALHEAMVMTLLRSTALREVKKRMSGIYEGEPMRAKLLRELVADKLQGLIYENPQDANPTAPAPKAPAVKPPGQK